jgi:transposase
MHTHETIAHVGVDGSKRHLDVASSEGSSVKRFDNWPHGREQLLPRLPPPDRCQIVLESTGVYLVELVDFLIEHDYAVAVVLPSRVRDFARGMG